VRWAGNADENSDSVVGGLPSGPALFSLAGSGGLTVYDAAYLALAIEWRAKLATADKALAAAARRRGILWRPTLR